MRIIIILAIAGLLNTLAAAPVFAGSNAPKITEVVKKSYHGADMSCATANDAQLTVTATGGTGALQYSKDNGAHYQSSNVFSNLSGGSYQIMVKDSKGLTPTVATLVIINAPFQLKYNVIIPTDATCSSSADGKILATAMFGTGDYQFSKDNGAHYQSSDEFDNLQAGYYHLMVKDVNGCTASTSVTVEVTTTVKGSITSQTNITCGIPTGSVTVKGTGGSSYTYSIDGGNFSFNNTFNNLTQGSHNVAVKEFWGCTTVVPVNILSVLPAATITGNSTICTGNSANFNINISGTQGQQYSVIYKNSNGVKTTINNLVAGDNTIATAPVASNTTFSLVSVTTQPNCQGTVSGTAIITTADPGTWLGHNSNWNDGNNWSCGAIPTLTTNVTIPTSQNNPVVPSGISGVKNLTINQGASVTVLGTLQIAGYIGNKGQLDVTNGTLEFDGGSSSATGPTAQTISGSWFVNKTIKNLVISNTKGLSLSTTANDTLNITGILSFGKSNCTFNTNNNLTLKSTSEGTAGVADITNNGALKGNSIRGNVTVERYINIGNVAGQHGKSWIMVATPTQGKSIYETWMESGNKSISGYGTQITGKGTGFDATSAAPALKYFSDVNNSWIGVTNTNDPVYNPLGYMLFVRGDRTTEYPNISNTTLRTTGTLLTGSTTPVKVKAGKFQSVGNPYAAAVDIRKISATGINPDIIVWDPTLTIGNLYGVGAYQTLYKDGDDYRNLLPSSTFGPAGTINNNIESGMAFFVQSFDTDGQVYFTENAKVAEQGKGVAMREQTVSNDVARLSANLYAVNSDGTSYVADGVMQQFGSQYSDTIDAMDTRKIYNSTENIAIVSDNKNLVVERRNSLSAEDTIQYSLSGMANHPYRLVFNASGIESGAVNGFIVDSYTKTETPLNIDGDTQVDFTVTSAAASKTADRFRIVFKSLRTMPVTFTSVKANAHNDQVSVEWNVENQSNMKQYEVERADDGNKFSTIAVVNANNKNTSAYSWLDENPLQGNNYYRIRSVDLNGKITYTSIVKAQISDISVSIKVFPNPAQEAKVNLQLNNQPAGVYYARLINPIGQVIVSKKIVHQAGSSTEIIEWNQAAAKGIYNLQIAQPDGSTKVIRIKY